jgi:hypothetical protein
MKTLERIRKAFGKESMSHTWVFEWLARKVKSMLISIFDIKGIVHKGFVLVGQTVSYAYYCDIWQELCENMQRLCSELWRQKNWLLHHNSILSLITFFTREFLTKNNMTIILHAPCSLTWLPVTFLFPHLKGCHFDTINVIEAESWAVLNILTEHDFQDAYKNGRSTEKGAYLQKGTTFRVLVASRPKVSFWPDGSTSPWNYEYHLIFHNDGWDWDMEGN